MFSKEYRLRDTKEIAKVFKLGKYIHGSYTFIKYTPNKQKNVRVAITVSTKIFKQAVKRNKIKRLLREALKPHLPNLPNLDILIITKKELAINTPLAEIKKDTSSMLNKLTISNS